MRLCFFFHIQAKLCKAKKDCVIGNYFLSVLSVFKSQVTQASSSFASMSSILVRFVDDLNYDTSIAIFPYTFHNANNADIIPMWSKNIVFIKVNTRTAQMDHTIGWTIMCVEMTHMRSSFLSWFQRSAIDSYGCGFMFSWSEKMMSYFPQIKSDFHHF